jgi:cardiolipin synthase
VYVLTSAEAALSDSRWFLTESDLAQQAKHREALGELSQVARVRSAPNWHTKFVLVDPRTNPQGVLLSANLNSQALRSSPELGVRLAEAEVRAFFEIARAAFWSAASEIRDGVWSNSPRRRDVAPPGNQSDIISTLSFPAAVLARLQDQLKNTENVVLTTYSVDGASPVLNMLRRLAKHGIAITIICHPSRNNARSLKQLVQSGCTVLGVDWLHAKLLDAGGDEVLMVTQNLDVASNKPRLETAMVLRDQRAHDARAWLDYWIKSAEWVMQ